MMASSRREVGKEDERWKCMMGYGRIGKLEINSYFKSPKNK
jgi:hypothetical protein